MSGFLAKLLLSSVVVPLLIFVFLHLLFDSLGMFLKCYFSPFTNLKVTHTVSILLKVVTAYLTHQSPKLIITFPSSLMIGELGTLLHSPLPPLTSRFIQNI